MARKICVFTGTRAEYGLLYWLMKEMQADPRIDLQVLVSGSHLEPEFGETWRQIAADGFAIDAKVDMHLDSDAPVAVAKSMALGLAGCAEALDRLKPDLLVVLGDRYEALAAAEAALLLRVPIAHIHGGEATEGAIDDQIRHAITKMAHLHFAAAELYRERILQLGEAPERVFTVGAPGLDHIDNIKLLGRRELERDLGFRFGERNLLVTYHPATLDRASPAIRPAPVGRARPSARSPRHHNQVERRCRWPRDQRSDRRLCGRAPRASPRGQFARATTIPVGDGAGRRGRGELVERHHRSAGHGQADRQHRAAPAGPRPRALGNRLRRRYGRNPRGDWVRAVAAHAQAMAARRESPYGSGGASKRIKDVLATVELDFLLAKRFHPLRISLN